MKKLLTKILQTIIIGICIFLFGWLIRWGLENQLYSTANENSIIFPDGYSKDEAWEGLWVDAEIISIDQLNGNLTVRLDFDPSEDLLDERDRLAEDLSLTILGHGEYLYQKGESLHRQIVSLSLHGAPIDYPLDKYTTNLDLFLSIRESENEESVYYPIPLIVEFEYTDSPGFSFEFVERAKLSDGPIHENTGFEEGHAEIVIIAQHSKVGFVFIIFLAFLQWVLAISAFLVSLVTIVQKRKIAIPAFGWLGALIFAQITLRNVMPNAPPIGTLGDRLSFFWALGIITFSMFALIITWVLRGEK